MSVDVQMDWVPKERIICTNMEECGEQAKGEELKIGFIVCLIGKPLDPWLTERDKFKRLEITVRLAKGEELKIGFIVCLIGKPLDPWLTERDKFKRLEITVRLVTL
ncbi:hypothetical protein L1987_47321 [Smallanthus sonchifolius]|uniref:Uncharacterized protein n=1 Tax=Smallanthus sonchifolius TaxID=185202 RepID=A0ACB9G3A5_9ASTR|nr:hypothetical protein L1987_47321 [Smallanthus sonchifolius]